MQNVRKRIYLDETKWDCALLKMHREKTGSYFEKKF